MTPAELVQALHSMADEVGQTMERFPGALPLMRITLKPGPDGERVVLVCGLEPAADRDAVRRDTLLEAADMVTEEATGTQAAATLRDAAEAEQ